MKTHLRAMNALIAAELAKRPVNWARVVLLSHEINETAKIILSAARDVEAD